MPITEPTKRHNNESQLNRMYDTTQIPSKHQPLTAASDDFGQYGSIFAPDSDNEVPQPHDLSTEQDTLGQPTQP